MGRGGGGGPGGVVLKGPAVRDSGACAGGRGGNRVPAEGCGAPMALGWTRAQATLVAPLGPRRCSRARRCSRDAEFGCDTSAPSAPALGAVWQLWRVGAVRLLAPTRAGTPPKPASRRLRARRPRRAICNIMHDGARLPPGQLCCRRPPSQTRLQGQL